ncbi:MAG: hypothetical protein C5B50_19150 [Verrucomicrobia bacterium]|nr:MAG: hypothetical protein C5B50_19150 [Verrucomicrobiota bacterium]
MSSMKPATRDWAAVDEAILRVALPRWQKVATIIAKTSDARSFTLPEGEKGYEQIASRVEGLIQAGRLEVQGNPKLWRNSEVRLP